MRITFKNLFATFQGPRHTINLEVDVLLLIHKLDENFPFMTAGMSYASLYISQSLTVPYTLRMHNRH